MDLSSQAGNCGRHAVSVKLIAELQRRKEEQKQGKEERIQDEREDFKTEICVGGVLTYDCGMRPGTEQEPRLNTGNLRK